MSQALALGPQPTIALVSELLLTLPGVRTVTWLATAPDRSVTHRIGTTDPVGFPIGGFDPIDDSAWNQRIFGEKRAIVGDTPEQMAQFIPETDQLVTMGYGATLCAPIIIAGDVPGVVCLLGDAGIFTPATLAEIDTILPIAALVFTFKGISAR
ncbi:MAG TPA: hypothetical protein VL133_16440 [Devosia sp.]|nr:hypothetical protein [Devosia sp.]